MTKTSVGGTQLYLDTVTDLDKWSQKIWAKLEIWNELLKMVAERISIKVPPLESFQYCLKSETYWGIWALGCDYVTHTWLVFLMLPLHIFSNEIETVIIDIFNSHFEPERVLKIVLVYMYFIHLYWIRNWPAMGLQKKLGNGTRRQSSHLLD